MPIFSKPNTLGKPLVVSLLAGLALMLGAMVFSLVAACMTYLP